MIRNPVLPGFNPDPSILRVGEEIDGYRLLSVGEGRAVFFRKGSRLVLTVEDEETGGGRD